MFLLVSFIKMAPLLRRLTDRLENNRIFTKFCNISRRMSRGGNESAGTPDDDDDDDDVLYQKHKD